jgi:hypothetical protein
VSTFEPQHRQRIGAPDGTEPESAALVERLRAEIALLRAGNDLLRHTLARYARQLAERSGAGR